MRGLAKHEALAPCNTHQSDAMKDIRLRKSLLDAGVTNKVLVGENLPQLDLRGGAFAVVSHLCHCGNCFPAPRTLTRAFHTDPAGFGFMRTPAASSPLPSCRKGWKACRLVLRRAGAVPYLRDRAND